MLFYESSYICNNKSINGYNEQKHSMINDSSKLMHQQPQSGIRILIIIMIFLFSTHLLCFAQKITKKYIRTQKSIIPRIELPIHHSRVNILNTIVFNIPNTEIFVHELPKNYTPQYAIEEAERHIKLFLAKNSESASDLLYRFFYNNEGEACLEYTVVAKGGYTWPNPTWIGYTWGNSTGSIGNHEINYTKTKKKRDLADYRMEQRRRDPVFREIEKIVLQIATEYDYDFGSAYGTKVKYRSPNIKKSVCGGYSDAISTAFEGNQYVNYIEKWSSKTGNHAWNVIVLKDGRRIYCDVTWYDGNSIDDEGYVVSIPVQNPVDLTFEVNEFIHLGGAINKATGKLLDVHFGWRDAKQETKK